MLVENQIQRNVSKEILETIESQIAHKNIQKIAFREIEKHISGKSRKEAIAICDEWLIDFTKPLSFRVEDVQKSGSQKPLYAFETEEPERSALAYEIASMLIDDNSERSSLLPKELFFK